MRYDRKLLKSPFMDIDMAVLPALISTNYDTTSSLLVAEAQGDKRLDERSQNSCKSAVSFNPHSEFLNFAIVTTSRYAFIEYCDSSRARLT